MISLKLRACATLLVLTDKRLYTSVLGLLNYTSEQVTGAVGGLMRLLAATSSSTYL
jgi:hypothetical protein